MNHLLRFLNFIITTSIIVMMTMRMIDTRLPLVLQKQQYYLKSQVVVVGFVHGIRYGTTTTTTVANSLRDDRYRHDASAFIRSKRRLSIYNHIQAPSQSIVKRPSHQTTMRLLLSTSLNRMTSPRSNNSQYASSSRYDTDHSHSREGDDVLSSYYDSQNQCNNQYRYPSRVSHATVPTTTFQYTSFPSMVCGVQLSAVPFSNDHLDDPDEQQQSQSRPLPPTLSDETSYGDGFGAYQYNNQNNDDTITNSYTYNDDIYDQVVPPKEPSRFIPKTSIESKYAKIKPTMNSGGMYRTKPPQSSSAKTTAQSARPPVQVSIPSLSTNDDVQTQLQTPIDVDLSVYDNLFDDSSNDSTTTSPTETTTAVVHPEPEVKVTVPKDIIKSTTTKRPTESESLIPATHFHVGQTLNDLSGYDPALDQFLSKAAYGVGTTTSIDVLQGELIAVEEAIYEHNNQQKFNVNSPKQVAVALFGTNTGTTNYSTNKDVLEAMAGAGNRLAALILEYRSIKYKLAKFVRQKESRNKGTAVRSAMTVARPTKTSTTEIQPETISSTNQQTMPIDTDMSTKQQSVVSEMRDVIADPLLLLDASAYIFRAYYSMPPIHRPDGMPTGAVMGFCKMLNSLLLNRMLEGEQPRLVLCFDAKGKTFRHEIYKKYKANRASAPMDLVPQFDLVRQAAKAYGICQIEAQRFEADDVIATLACKAVEEGVDANIMSGDKDLMQLVTDFNATPSIQIIDPMKKERTTYQQVMEKWQVPPDKLGDLLALAGDTADNVPGVRGIGPKTAAKLINDFGSLENLLNNIDSVKQQGIREKLFEDKANARLSRILVELNCTVPMSELTGLPDGIHQKVSDLRMEAIDPDRIIAFYDQMGFKDLKRSFQNSLKGLNVKRKKSSSYNKRVRATIPTPEDYKDVPF